MGTTESILQDPIQYRHRVQMAIPLRIGGQINELSSASIDPENVMKAKDLDDGTFESAVCCRHCLSGFSVTTSFLAVAMGLYFWAVSELLVVWNWPSWIKYVLYILAALVFIGYLFVFCAVRRKTAESGFCAKWKEWLSSETNGNVE